MRPMASRRGTPARTNWCTVRPSGPYSGSRRPVKDEATAAVSTAANEARPARQPSVKPSVSAAAIG